ncbi:MAG: hypothetical protein OES09_14500 [Gammaproteobacteria bacterium]|nr:hypothetical protein [Gammaproteobacteria bacterium]
MNQRIAIENISAALAREMLFPVIMVWNRLEGRPRTKDFHRALRAEVRDPLWMLTKQWQVGEFKGDDAGSPVFAKVHMATTKLHKYKPNDAQVRPFDNQVPFEATVEQRPVPFVGQQHILSLDIRLLMGRQWIKLLNSVGLGGLGDLYIDYYGVNEPSPDSREDIAITAHPPVWQHFSALTGRAMDGASLYFYLKGDTTRHAYDGIAVPEDKKDDIDEIAERFIGWYEKLFYQPVGATNDAWVPEQLEYQFDVSAPKGGKEKVLVAEEYYHGRLDWYNLDVDPSRETLVNGEGSVETEGDAQSLEDAFTSSFIPTSIQFEGMPNTRWWTFEDGKTNFGDVKPDTTDINKLLLMEFGLVYANDWFMVPVQLPVGSLANVQGLMVTNVFGERIWVEASGSGQDENWQRWAMYNLAVRGSEDTQADTTLVLLPTVPKISESKPIDEVYLIRDEVANMVWGIEKSVPLPNGGSKPGREAAIELSSRYKQFLDSEIGTGLVIPQEPEYRAAIRYQLMTSVPENWIPFIPTHKDGDNREIQLQRASMPRIIPGDPNLPEKIKPRTVLLRHGLEETPPQPYFVYEEGVVRAGVRVFQTYQRTRWHDGGVFTWLGVRKQTGRGEGSSGLAFDRVKPTNKD